MVMIITISVMSCAIGALAYALYRQRDELKYMQKEWSRMHNAELGELREDLQSLCVGTSSTGSRVTRIETVCRLINERIENLQAGQQRERPYGRAIQMVHNGADVSDLVENFSLSANEAELIVSLHQAS